MAALRSPQRASSLLVMILVCAVLRDASSARAAENNASAQVARRKALFIEQFTRLIRWPPAALADDRPFVLCLRGASAPANELANLAAARRFKGRKCEVRRIAPERNSDLTACHVVYLAASEAPRLSQILQAVDGKPVLVVGDTPGFAQRGVHLNLFEENRATPQPATYVNYELNVSAVKRSVLVFDPQLLSQGRRVDTASPQEPRGPGR